MVALVSLLTLVALFMTVSRVAAVALEATGMARDSAQFQSRSALMGVGFTTSEAEDITSHPQRRRVVLWLMTLGNAGIVTGVASLLLAFVNTETTETLQRSAMFVGGLAVLVAALHTERVNRLINVVTRSALRRFTDLDTRDFSALMRFESDFAVTELHVSPGDWLLDRRLSELHLTSEGVVVLGIHRSTGGFLGAPTGDTEIHLDDRLLAYGQAHVLSELAIRPRTSGDDAHADAVEEHAIVVETETETDESDV